MTILQPDADNHPIWKLQEGLWLLVVLLTPLLVNLWVEQQFEASKIWLLRTLVWILAVAWLGGWMSGLRPRLPPAPIGSLSIFLLLVICLSTLLSVNRTIALTGTLDRASGALTQISYLLLFWCVATRIDPARSQRMVTGISLTAIPICLLGLAQAAGWHPLPVVTDARSLLTTTLGRANFTGAYLALMLPLTLVSAQSATEGWRRTGYGTLFVLEGITIVLTQARAAWLAGVVAIGVLLWVQRAPRWTRPGRWFSALGGLTILAGALLPLLHDGIARGGSIAARWTIWRAALRLLWPRLWLGYGGDTLELHFPAVYPPQLVYYQGRDIVVDRAHNWLLDWSLDYGIVAALVLLALVLIILGRGWQRLTTPVEAAATIAYGTPFDTRLLGACMAGICAHLIGNFFLFEVAATAVVFWLLLAILTAATAGSVVHKTETALPMCLPMWMRSTIMAGCVLLVGWAIWQYNARPLLADIHSRRGTGALARGAPIAALTEYRAAVHHQPRRAAYRVSVALVAARVNQVAEAERAIHEAIALRPTDPLLYTHLAAIYAHEATRTPARVRMAFAAYEEAIARAATLALTYRRYADLALRTGNGEIARLQAQRAVDLDATDGLAFGILGWSHLQAGDLAAAQAAFEQAVKWRPDSADFYLGLATVYFQQTRFVEAQQAVQHSLDLDPVYAPALQLQIELQEKGK